MKKLLFMLTGLAAFSIQANAQAVASSDVPVTIRTSFTQQFGTDSVSSLAWETMSNRGYSASFLKNNEMHYVEYDGENKVVLHRFQSKSLALPASIADAIKKDYPNHKVEEVDRIEKNGVVTYEVEVEGKPDYELFFDGSGKLLKRELD